MKISKIIIIVLPLILVMRGTYAGLPGENSLSADQNISSLEEKDPGVIPGDRILPTFNFSDPEVKEIADNARETLEKIPKSPSILEQAPAPRSDKKKRSSPSTSPQEDNAPLISQQPNVIPEFFPRRSGIKIFRPLAQIQRRDLGETIILPNGATALVSSRAGIEVEEGERQAKKLDIRLDYAFLGPNEAVVELTGCVGWIKVWGKYNTERVYGELEEISCRAPDGDTFTVKASGIIKDFDDEYVGAKGKFIANGKFAAAALSFLQDGTTEFGKALSMAQVSREVVSNDRTVEAGMSIGDKSQYIVGKSVAGATGRFLNWWVDFYTGLAPTMAIGPGKKLFLTVRQEIEIPKKFFSEVKKVNTDQTVSIHKLGKLEEKP